MALPEYKYLRVGELQALRSHSVTVRRRVEGRYAGRHASPQRGQSVEFSDYRPYSPGDEIADIDWKAYARSDKLFLKLFEHSTDTTLTLLVDASASMAFRGMNATGDSKFDYACRVAASLAYLMTRRRDRVSLAVAQDGLASYVEPGASYPHLVSLLQTMERIHPAGHATLAGAIEALTRRMARRSLVAIFSDLYEDPAAILRSLRLLTTRGSQLALFHVLHPDELRLPRSGDVLFQDSESTGRLRIDTNAVATRYDQLMNDFLTAWSARITGSGAEYIFTSTHTPYVATVRKFLRERGG